MALEMGICENSGYEVSCHGGGEDGGCGGKDQGAVALVLYYVCRVKSGAVGVLGEFFRKYFGD